MSRANTPVNDADLHDYVDGELDQPRVLEVEAYLAKDPRAAERVRQYQQISQNLHRLFDPILNVQVPPSLAPPVELMDFDEMTFPEAEQLDLDSAGRIRLPQELVAESRLGPRVLLVGVRHHLEIWDPEVWEARRRERATRRADVVQRARPVMPEGGGRAHEQAS